MADPIMESSPRYPRGLHMNNEDRPHATADTPAAIVPPAGQIVGLILTIATTITLSIFLTRRISKIRKWKQLPLTCWLTLVIYIDSLMFVSISAILTKGMNINGSPGICDGAILLCLVCYMSTKHIVHSTQIPRFKDKLYIFNFFVIICPFWVVIVLNFVFRIAFIDNEGVCIIGMERPVIIPLIVYDVGVNSYLTILFLIPLTHMYSFRANTTNVTPAIRTVAVRTFFGSCGSLLSSIVNLVLLTLFNGEPGWVCLMSCNADVLFSAVVIHWVTTVDNASGQTNCSDPTLAESAGVRTIGGGGGGPNDPESNGGKGSIAPNGSADNLEAASSTDLPTWNKGNMDGQVTTTIVANPQPHSKSRFFNPMRKSKIHVHMETTQRAVEMKDFRFQQQWQQQQQQQQEEGLGRESSHESESSMSEERSAVDASEQC
ncbi:MAG: hypothetical protein M1834_001181 [Cirrosporium novae-zelandiae]|nr:MAG: hypothetical protein M1834_001181 [Cirrosporium novae-zelandiae]